MKANTRTLLPLPADALPPAAMPPAVYLLGATVFAITTSEFMVAGLMPALAQAFGVSTAEIGYLISYFALGMALGGPLATAGLIALRIPDRPALLSMLGLFLAGSVLAALAPTYGIMVIARTIQGVASAACFGIAITICAKMVHPHLRGRAVSLVLAGLMLSPVLGVPVTTVISQNSGWQAAFWSIVVVAALCMPAVAFGVPAARQASPVNIASGLADLNSRRLWAAYTTSALIIGATFAAFSYFSAIFTGITGLPDSAIPALLAAYGAANIAGNLVVGRLADRWAMSILICGLAVLAMALAVFALFAANTVISIAAFIAIGLTGVSLNPAMATRVMRAAQPGPLVNSLHTSMITAGLALGTWAGGFGIDAGFGLRAPLWAGFGLALLGLLSLAPRRFRSQPANPAVRHS